MHLSRNEKSGIDSIDIFSYTDVDFIFITYSYHKTPASWNVGTLFYKRARTVRVLIIHNSKKTLSEKERNVGAHT